MMLPGRYRQNISNETLRDARDDSSNQPPELVEQVVIKSTRYATTNITPSIFTGRFCITRTEKNDWINVTIIIILSKYLLIIFFYNSTCIKYCKVINNFSYFMTTILLFRARTGSISVYKTCNTHTSIYACNYLSIRDTCMLSRTICKNILFLNHFVISLTD